MHALLTGVSSFTGSWFATALAQAGFAVTAITRQRLADYSGLARTRLLTLPATIRRLEVVATEGMSLAKVVRDGPPVDLLCLHGATVGDHRSATFDVLQALTHDTAGMDELLDVFAEQGGRAVIVTGSIFEADACSSLVPRTAFNNYGLAKSLTWQMIRYAVERRGLTLGRFVIAHPFGPMEKRGLTTSIADAWRRGEIPLVQQPNLVRDFVPVDALAGAYTQFGRRLIHSTGTHLLTPSGYAESTGCFVDRFAGAIRRRTRLECRYAVPAKPDPVDEPMICVGRDPLPGLLPSWEPERSWSRLADWYANNTVRAATIN